MGVEHTQPEKGRKLVIDIGGGSTELVIGENFEPILVESRRMGCVSFAQLYFLAGSSIKKFSARSYGGSTKTGNFNTAIPYSGLERGNGRFRYHKSRP